MIDGHPELLVEPERDGLAERVEGAREGRDVRGEHALELQQGLVVEAHRVELVDGDARLLEHVLDGPGGEVLVVLLAAEPLLLAGGHDLPVAQERGGGVVVEAGDAEDVGGHQNWWRAAASGPEGVGLVAPPERGLRTQAAVEGVRSRAGA